MKRSLPSNVARSVMMERRVLCPRTIQLRSIGVGVKPHDVPGVQVCALVETDYVGKQSVGVQTIRNTTDKASQCAIAPTNRYQYLDEKEKLFMRIGEAFVNMDLKECLSTGMSGKLKSSGDDIVRNVIHAMSFIQSSLGEDAKSTPFRSIVESASSICGVHRTTVSRHAEVTSESPKTPKTPLGKKKRDRRAASRLSILNRFKINKQIHTMWKNDQNVTTDRLLEWARANVDFKGARTTFYHILRGMGYCDKKRTLNTVIEERFDIVRSRAEFLKKKEAMDKAGVYFGATDETWNHDGMTSSTAWQHNNRDMYQRARMVDLETPMAGPRQGKHRGKRGIVLAVLTEEGVLPGSEKCLISGVKVQDQKMDYHQEMNGDTFEIYFKEVVPLLKAAADKQGRPAALIVDNASYHNKSTEKPPTSNSVKADIVAFLQRHNVPHHIGMLRKDLVVIMTNFIKQNGGRAAFTVYELDQWAMQQGVQVLRLPPYHCFWNPIELLWAQLKQHLRSVGSVADSLEIVRTRTLDFLKNFPAQNARSLMDHTRELEEEIREMMAEKALTLHDEAFKLSYDIDDTGKLINVHISEDEDDYDDNFFDSDNDGGLYDDFLSEEESEIDEMA